MTIVLLTSIITEGLQPFLHMVSGFVTAGMR